MAVKRKNIKLWQRVEHVKTLKKTDKCCVFCKTPWSSEILPTLDHVIPVSAGGSNDISNLRLACGSCNNLRGSIPFDVFKSNVQCPESRENYREALAREGKDEELYKQRKERNEEQKKYLAELRNQFGKDDLQDEVYILNKQLRIAIRNGDGKSSSEFRKKLALKQEELSLTCELIRLKFKIKFSGRKFKV